MGLLQQLSRDVAECNCLDYARFTMRTQSMIRLISCKMIACMVSPRPSFPSLTKNWSADPCCMDVSQAVECPNWLPSIMGTGHELETMSLLGPFFAFSHWMDFVRLLLCSAPCSFLVHLPISLFLSLSLSIPLSSSRVLLVGADQEAGARAWLWEGKDFGKGAQGAARALWVPSSGL